MSNSLDLDKSQYFNGVCYGFKLFVKIISRQLLDRQLKLQGEKYPKILQCLVKNTTARDIFYRKQIILLRKGSYITCMGGKLNDT